MNRYCFIDSSGVLHSDAFFGTGLLMVRNVGDLADKLYKNSQPAKAAAVAQKNKVIDTFLAQNKINDLVSMLRNNKHFEMKFDTVRPSAEEYYARMVDIFFSDSENRFSAMVVNKQDPAFDGNGIEDAWETYTKYAAALVVKEMKNMPGDNLCIVVDEISRPRNKPMSLEDTLLAKIRDEVASDPNLDFNTIFGALNIESHSNFLMQLSDLLLGAVMYDYKKDTGLASAKTQSKKEAFVAKIRNTLQVPTLAADITIHTPAYFDVSECI